MNSPLTQYKPQELAAIDTSAPPIIMGFGSAAGFELMQRGAKMLSSSTMVPKEYQGNLSNCAIALNMAHRMGADPMMVMQNLYNVHGRPSWSAKFLIATFNQCGRFTSVRYEKQSSKGNKDWGCRAWATEKATGERIEGPLITWEMVDAEGWNKKNGSKWLTIPDLMFMYRAAAWMINAHAPEISMGLSTAEEMHDALDAQLDGAGNYAVSDRMQTTMDKLRETTGQPTATGETIDMKTGEVMAPEDPKPQDSKVAAAPAAKYADVLSSLKTAVNQDELDEAADLIRSVTNPTHQRQLNTLYEERTAAFNGEEAL